MKLSYFIFFYFISVVVCLENVKIKKSQLYTNLEVYENKIINERNENKHNKVTEIIQNNNGIVFKKNMRKIEKNSNVNCSQDCLICDTSSTITPKCKKCIKGYFAYENNCYNSCPSNTFSDNYSLSCKSKEENPIYIKAYTFSKCINSCGKIFDDCSCSEHCVKKGNCCSDYEICDIVKNEGKSQCVTENCKYCVNIRKNKLKEECMQCQPGYFLYNHNCFKICPKNTKVDFENNICIKRDKCTIENCESCFTKKNICNKCDKGYFLFEGVKCTTICPIGTVADKDTKTCTFSKNMRKAYYWVYPSVESCQNKCGFDLQGSECSCSSNCLRNASCCDDFDNECPDEKLNSLCINCQECEKGQCLRCKDNSKLIDNQCTCNNGYKYNNFSDECELVQTNPNQHAVIEIKGDTKEGTFNVDSLRNIISNFFNSENFHSNPLGMPFMNTNNSHLFINGNITMNVYENNDNPVIKHEHIMNTNSYNNDTLIEHNNNAQNILIDSKPQNDNHPDDISSDDISSDDISSDNLYPVVQKKKSNFEKELQEEKKNNINTKIDVKPTPKGNDWHLGDDDNHKYDKEDYERRSFVK